jgi:hypothetical protein
VFLRTESLAPCARAHNHESREAFVHSAESCTPDEGLAPRNRLLRSWFQIAFRCFRVTPEVVSGEGKGRT